MRVREALASALHLLVILFCFALASFAALLPFRPDWRIAAAFWLQEDPQQFYQISGAFALIGIFFTLSFYAISRGRITRLSMKSSSLSIERKLLKKVVDDFFSEHFPQLKAEVDLLPKENLELSMTVSSSEDEELLKKVEEQFSLLLRERFGYDKPFTLSLRHK